MPHTQSFQYLYFCNLIQQTFDILNLEYRIFRIASFTYLRSTTLGCKKSEYFDKDSIPLLILEF